MKAQEFLKGLMMVLVSVIVTAFSTQPIVWSVVIITLIGTALVYAGKNAIQVLQSTTGPNTLSWINILSGILIAIGSGVTEAIASIAGTGKIDWLLLGKVVLGVTLTYLGSTLFSGPNTTLNKQPDGSMKTQLEVKNLSAR